MSLHENEILCVCVLGYAVGSAHRKEISEQHCRRIVRDLWRSS